MEQKVIFRDNQQLNSADLNNQQQWMSDALDHVVLDTIESGQSYSGFQISKTGQTVVSFTPGRLYNTGLVYSRNEIVAIDLFNALPIVTQRRVAIVAWGQVLQTDNEPRGFLVDASTGRAQPQTVPMEEDRYCNLSNVNGVEAPDPQYPTTDASMTVIAYVLLDPTGVISTEQFPDTQVENLRDISDRTVVLESWRSVIGALVDTLKTDIGNIAARLSSFVLITQFQKLCDVVSGLAERIGVLENGTYFWYGTDYLLDTSQSETDATGYNCTVEEGIRFGVGTSTVTTALALNNPSDPSVSGYNGFYIPNYTNSLRLDASSYDYEERILQWVFRNPINIRNLFRTRRRHRCGRIWMPCPDAQVWWFQAECDPTTHIQIGRASCRERV